VSPSAPSEVAWVLDLLVQSAPYSRPATAELDQSLLPGLMAMRDSTRARYRALWTDDLGGCPELLPVAHHAGCLLDEDGSRFIQWLTRTTNHRAPAYELLAEPVAGRTAIQARIARLTSDGKLRSRYAALLGEIWAVMKNPWLREGRRIALDAALRWAERIETGGHIEDLVPPRHPLSRADQHGLDELFEHRQEFVLSPLYFCMSGGHVFDTGEYVHIAVAASDLLPIRKVRDAMFVADRLRVLAEPTRVHVLIQLMSAPAGVMDVARALRVSQPTVSGHIDVLRRAGLIQRRKLGSRSVYVASRKRIERLLEDARGTLARWD
jgi:DNA-binding transcriptional ArsR family regulator